MYMNKVALCACSDRLKNFSDFNKLYYLLRSKGIEAVHSDSVFKGASAADRARELEEYFLDPSVSAVFDVSGGDLANEILDKLDPELIKSNYKPFFGYSDLTSVVNYVAEAAGKPAYLWQIRNIIYRNREKFFDFVFEDKRDIFDFNYKFIRGEELQGRLLGGNIRCLLKTAGTKYFPDTDGAVLFLESNSGDSSRIRAYFAQLRQTGALEKISGLILGTFTQLEKDCLDSRAVNIALESLPPHIPVVKTPDIGHSVDSAALEIGSVIRLKAQ